MAQTEFKRLGTHCEVTLQQMDLCHEQMSISMGRTLVQAMLETALSSVSVT